MTSVTVVSLLILKHFNNCCYIRVNAAFSYKSQKPDELDLIKGDSYRVTEVCLDGWCRGSHLPTGKSGVFPGNYITPKTNLLPTSK